MNLYDLTLAAQSAVNTYRNPDIVDWIIAIDPVLTAAGQGSIGTDTVQEIEVSNHSVTIRTAYTVRGCDDTAEMTLPLTVVNAEDPLKEAHRYQLTEALAVAKHQAADAQRTLNRSTERVTELEAELAAITA
jgi:hypothetical protein